MAEHRSSSWLRWAIIFAGAVVLIGGGAWYFERRTADAPQYQTAPVARGDLEQVVTATGTLNPVVDVAVGCQVSGRVSQLFADYNSIVKSNQVIAQIDPSTYEAQVNQAKANLANAEANLELQEAELTRSAQLFTNNLLSSSDYDTAVATRDEAAAQVQIEEASLTNALANLSYCKILSPVDGIVISRDVDVGQTVAASLSAPTLFEIANDLTKMQIDAAVDEADIGGVREGQPVDFTVDAYPNRTFHGDVTQVRNAPTNSNNVITYDTVVGVDNTDLKLKPGMTATVSIIVADRTNILEIPNSALRFQPADAVEENSTTNGQATHDSNSVNRASGRGRGRGHGGQEYAVEHIVYVLTKDSAGATKLEPVQIQTGITDNINTEVLSGLKEGDQVVTGLQIPGLTASGQVDNPFAGRRRF
ncbi:MAG TPA: efflux RND transporter periplasmic adaptor subunit [Verrucomicrobiae bacterium]|nr:efflux RND transporter periplasmic adaptor subunit [Verrucomicrobiae bacterium]